MFNQQLVGPHVERPRAQLNLILTNCVFSNARAQAKDTVCLSRYSLHLATVFQSQVTNQASPPFYYIFESVATWRRLRKYETWRCPSLFCIYIANVCMNKYLYFVLFYFIYVL